MSANNTSNSYGWVSKTFHWAMFFIIVGQFWLGGNFKKDAYEGMGLSKLHFSVGLLILFLILIRFAWRAKNPIPELPEGTGKLQALGAHGLHILFYVLLIGLPVAGVLIVQAKGGTVSFFGIFDVPRFVAKAESTADFAELMHEVFAKITFLSVLLHIGMALFHHYVKKDNVLRRMLPW